MAIITLTSDLGLQDASLAIAKGIILQHLPSSIIIDITHLIQPFNLQQATYLFKSSYSVFPKGTYHIILFDLFNEKESKLIYSTTDNGHHFFSSDNYLLSNCFSSESLKSWLCETEVSQENFQSRIHSIAQTIQKTMYSSAEKVGLSAYNLKQKNSPNSDLSYKRDINILHIDKFGNVVIDYTIEEYNRMRNLGEFVLSFMHIEEIRQIHNHYTEVREGNKLCRFNSSGYMEICIHHGRADMLFGLKLGSKKNNINIHFR